MIDFFSKSMAGSNFPDDRKSTLHVSDLLIDNIIIGLDIMVCISHTIFTEI